jgi:hypothetical protein
VEFSIKSGSPEKQRSACVVVGVFESRKLTLPAELLDKAAGGYISDIVRRGDMEGKAGTTLLLHHVPGTLCDRVLLVGLGKEREFHEKEFLGAIRVAVRTLDETGASDASMFLSELPVRKRGVAWRVRQTVMIALDATYRFDRFKSKKEDARRPLRKLTLAVDRRNEHAPAERGLAQGMAIAEGMAVAKDLGNLPPNICHPTYLAEQAQDDGAGIQPGMRGSRRADMEKLGMRSLLVGSRRLAPAAQADRPPLPRRQARREACRPGRQGRHLRYRRHFAEAGSRDGRNEVRHVRRRQRARHIAGGGAHEAADQSDRGRSGYREHARRRRFAAGRHRHLDVRADHRDSQYRCRRPPDPVRCADLRRTLRTGHRDRCRDADRRLCRRPGRRRQRPVRQQRRARPRPARCRRGSPRPRLAHAVVGRLSGAAEEPVRRHGQHRRPLGGAITAACFLSRFTKKFKWAHLDIAGTAWKSGKDKGATGRPVALLAHYLLQRAGQLN